MKKYLIKMNFLRLTIEDLFFSSEIHKIDNISLNIHHNNTSNIFSPPFIDLPLQVSSTCPIISLKFLIQNKIIGTAKVIHDEISEQALKILNDQHQDIGSLKIKVQTYEKRKCDICNEIKDIFSFNDKLLEETQSLIKENFENFIKIQDFNEKVEEIEKICINSKIKDAECLLIGVNSKLKVFESLKQKFRLLEARIIEETEKNQKLENFIKNHISEALISNTKNENILKEKTKTIQELLQKLQNFQETQKKNENEIQKKNIQIELLNEELKRLNFDKNIQKFEENLIKDLKISIKTSENFSTSLKENIEKIQTGHHLNLFQQQDLLDKIIEENSLLSQKFQKSEENYLNLKTKYEELCSINTRLESTCKINEITSHCLKDLEKTCENYKLSVIFHQNQASNYQIQLVQTTKTFENYQKA